MDTNTLIASIEAEISRLQQVRSLLVGEGRTPRMPSGPRKRRRMSAEGRARIAAAQKKRWAKQKRATKK